MPPFALQARLVYPVTSPVLVDGIITIDGSQIVAVGENQSGRPAHDLGHVAIVPGLVNAHTHLEFSQLAEPLGQPGILLPDWIRLVLANRATPIDRAQAIRDGIQQCLAHGTTTVGEIAQPAWPQQAWANASLDAILFLELIGLAADRVTGLRQLASEHLNSLKPTTKRFAGLSPHAPYSVHPDLVGDFDNRVPIAMHLAESQEELELLALGTGPLAQLLVDLGLDWQTTLQPGTRPLDYLQRLATAHRALVVHGNYLTDDELTFVAAHRDVMSLVYCPRTHQFFQHSPYPLAKARAGGINVALGTDSLASSPNLSLWAEMQTVAVEHPTVPADEVLKMGTLNGARALGCEQTVGSLDVGKLANLAIVHIPEPIVSKPEQLLTHPEAQVVATWYRGQQVFPVENIP